MKKLVLFLTLSIAGLLIPAMAEATATSCFDFDCTTGAAGYCTFNGGCSTGTPFVWKYNWDFGDGTSTGLTGQSTQNHTYSICHPGVTLTVYTWDGDIESVQCIINNRLPNCPGPLPPTSGRCSQ